MSDCRTQRSHSRRWARFGGESNVRIVPDRDTKSFRCGLQEIAIARRALRVELEILNTAILEDDELISCLDVHDDLRIL